MTRAGCPWLDYGLIAAVIAADPPLLHRHSRVTRRARDSRHGGTEQAKDLKFNVITCRFRGRGDLGTAEVRISTGERFGDGL